jgi:hypothetical protein
MMVWARQFPGYFDNKNQNLTFSQISSFSSIDDLLTEFINSDIDDFFRASHFEQINKIFNKFKIDQDASKIDGIEKFQKFCKLRNLIVHNGSRADKEYCSYYPSGDVNVNDLIKIEHNDVQEAARIVFSVGFRLACVVLLKISKNSKSAALSVIELSQKISYDLIHEYHYEMAEDILKFILNLKIDFTDQQKKMLKVNYANSIKLQKNRNDEFEVILNGEDWSAATEDFRICIAAIREDISGLCHLMKLHSNSKIILKDSYIDWPVFRSVQESDEFKECYKLVFGEDHKLIMRPIISIGVEG